jgi:phage-related holin
MIIIGCLFNWALNVPKYVIYGIVLYVIIMELISICENLDKMGVPIPKFIKKALRNAEYKIQNDDPNKKDGDAE